VAQWLERYVEGWRTYDAQVIGGLFTEDATYRYHPWDDPVIGRDAIVANWLESPDEPNSWSAQYEPYAIDGDRAVTIGFTNYFGEDRRTIERSFYNVWLLRFDDEGRCKEFIETYMQMPEQHG
jgi:hypothetical protein